MLPNSDHAPLFHLKSRLLRCIGTEGFFPSLRNLVEELIGRSLLGFYVLKADKRIEFYDWNPSLRSFCKRSKVIDLDRETLVYDDESSGSDLVLFEATCLKAIKLHFMLLKPSCDRDPFCSCLTQRELEIVELIVAYKSNKQISEKLGVSIRTVEKHCQNIFEKLEVENRTSLIYLATLSKYEGEGAMFRDNENPRLDGSFEPIIAELFDSIWDEHSGLIQKFVVSIGEITDSKFTNFSVHAPNSDLESVVTHPDPTVEQLQVIPEINRYIDEQPVLRHLQNHKKDLVYTKISDFLSDAEFRKTNLYQKGYQPIGFDYMMTAAAWDHHGRLYAFNITRPDRDFAEQERDILKQVFPLFLKSITLKRSIQARKDEFRNVLELTFQQKLILFWIGEGKNNQEISIITGKSTKNVEKHVSKLLKAMGLSKRYETLDYRLKQKQVQFPAIELSKNQ